MHSLFFLHFLGPSCVSGATLFAKHTELNVTVEREKKQKQKQNNRHANNYNKVCYIVF